MACALWLHGCLFPGCLKLLGPQPLSAPDRGGRGPVSPFFFFLLNFMEHFSFNHDLWGSRLTVTWNSAPLPLPRLTGHLLGLSFPICAMKS